MASLNFITTVFSVHRNALNKEQEKISKYITYAKEYIVCTDYSPYPFTGAQKSADYT